MYAHTLQLPGLLPSLKPYVTQRFIQQTVNPLVVAALLLSLIAPALPSWGRMQPIHFQSYTNQDTATTDFDLLTLPSSPGAAGAGGASATASSWRGHTELVSLRDAFTRYYDMGNGQTAAIASADALHYEDAAGNWLTIDPRFVTQDDGFTIRADTLQTSLGSNTSAALFQHGESMLGWVPSALTVLDGDGAAISTLAEPLDPADDTVTETALSEDGQTVTYSGHWSDETLLETFVSDAGQVEQSLIFAQPPQIGSGVDGREWTQLFSAPLASLNQFFATPKWLSFETELHLLSGDSLVIAEDGQTVEIRDAAGDLRMTLAPIVAYEQDDPTRSVSGHYEAERLEHDVWLLRVLTPWSWWTDAERTYPAVLDPTVYVDVKNPVEIEQHLDYAMTGAEHDCGIYLNSDEVTTHVRIERAVAFCNALPDTQDDDLIIVADRTITSDLLFSRLPVLPTDANITGATLVLAGMVIGEEFPIEIVNAANNGVIQPYNLHVNQGEVVGSCQGQGCDLTESLTTNFVQEIELPADQIVPILETWYGGDNQGLILRPAPQNSDDKVCGPSTIDRGTGEENVRSTHGCSFISTEAVQLYIHYSERTLDANAKIINQPIPSFDDAYFGRSFHQYKTDTLPNDWSAVAVIGDAAVDGAPVNQHVFTPLEVMGKRIETRYQTTNNRTVQYVVLDNTGGTLPDNPVVRVDKHPDNFRDNFAETGIPGAHYDIQWSTPSPAVLTDPTPAGWTEDDRNLGRRNLVNVMPFNLPADHTLSVKVTVPDDTQVNVELYSPEPGMMDETAGDGLNDPYTSVRGGTDYISPAPAPDGDGGRIHFIDGENFSPFPQRWALVIAHDGVNTTCPTEPPGLAAAASVDGQSGSGCPTVQVKVEMLACPRGEYPTERFGCQSLIYPHAKLGGPIIAPPDNGNGEAASAETVAAESGTAESGTAEHVDAEAALLLQVPSTQFYDVGGVRIFSEGGFVGGPFGGTPDADIFGNGYQVCTINEDRGMPLFGTVAEDSVPALTTQAPSQRLTPVRQGSVCVSNENKIHVVGTRIPDDPDNRSYGAIVAPSIRENEARPVRIFNNEEDAYHGRIDTGANFGSLSHGGMVQNDGDEFRLDVNGLVQLTANPWDGWVGMPQQGFPRYIEIDEYSATGEQNGTVKVTAEPNSPADSSVDMAVDSTWRRRAKLPNPGFELELDANVAVPNMPVVSMDLRVHAAGQPYVPTNGDKVTEIHLDDVTIHQRENLGGAPQTGSGRNQPYERADSRCRRKQNR